MSLTAINFFDKQIKIQRILYSLHVSDKAPTIVFFGGIHGNEPAGIYGLLRVIDTIKEKSISLTGNFYAIAGNLNALKKNIRYEQVDLNRLWNHENVAALDNNNHNNPEIHEQKELYGIIKSIVKKSDGPFYFIDLHTTSAETIPFITISDSINNRKFASKFSIPIILGIEEFLEGPLLTYINEFGYVSLGFEAGQHQDLISIDNCENFILRALSISGCAKQKTLNLNNSFDKYLKRNNLFYEINYRYLLRDKENFKIVYGFKNFDKIKKNQVLAISNNKEVKSKINGTIFMPLYQKQGKEGFFIINPLSKFWLQLSSFLRKLKFHHFLRLLPGIKQDSENKYTLIVNPKMAKYLAVEIFHLFGYRKKVSKNDKLYFIRRDREINTFF